MLIARIAAIYGTGTTLQDLSMLSTAKRGEITTYLDERRAAFDPGDAAGSYEVISALIADIGGPNQRPNGGANVSRWQAFVSALGKYVRP